jgi:hypothetical protein
MIALFTLVAALLLVACGIALYIACRRVERVVEAVKLRRRADERGWS